MKKLQINKDDPRIKVAIATIVIAAVTYYGAEKVIMKSFRENIAKLNAKLEHIRAEDELSQLANEVISYEKSLAPQKDPAWLLSQLTDLAKQAKVQIEAVEPLPTKQIPPYTYVSYRVKANCTFLQLINYVKLVEINPSMMNIEDLRLDPKDKAPNETLKEEETNNDVIATVEIAAGTLY